MRIFRRLQLFYYLLIASCELDLFLSEHRAVLFLVLTVVCLYLGRWRNDDVLCAYIDTQFMHKCYSYLLVECIDVWSLHSMFWCDDRSLHPGK